MAQAAPSEKGVHLIPLVLLSLSLLQGKQQRNDEASKLRAQATRLLDAINADIPPMEVGDYHHLMAQILNRLDEYRRAIPFWERAIRLLAETSTPMKMSDMLRGLGHSYFKTGLSDYAAIPFRAAYKILAAYPEDPRLPNILMDLGNSLRKTSPAEAEDFYKQAANFMSARLQYRSATSVWGNLGILCSEQGRHAEALEYHQKTLRVREQTPDTPSASLALALNNIANCYRRIGNYSEAHASINRALKLITSRDTVLASIYGTRGQIFLDSGDNIQAVESLRKAIAERQRQPAPNLEALIINLQDEIVALKRLGRADEIAIAEQALISVRETIQSFAPADCNQSAGRAQLEGSVLVELPYGNKSSASETQTYSTSLADYLSQVVHGQKAGYYNGWVSVADSTSLIFYGKDAELLFKALEPSLTSEPICAGSRVVVRQGSISRELVLPNRPAQLN